jgi:exopolysaccharide production protein ExoQ
MDGATTYRRVLTTAGFFSLMAGDLWRYLFTWWGWGAIVLALLIATVVELVRSRADLRQVPVLLVVTLALMTLSIAWSAYPAASALGVLAVLATTVFGVFAATCLDWREIVATLGNAARWALGLSLIFELAVATIIRRPILPLWVDYSDLDRIPKAFYWSRDLLFEGGRIQGIVGNANLLAMIALIGLIVTAVQFFDGRGSRPWQLVWAAVAVGTLALTRSSTVLIAAVVTLAAVLVIIAVRRRTGRARIATAAIAGGGALLLAGLALLLRGPILALLGRSDDLTNRLDIWSAVVDLAGDRPAAGWGWIGYWAPWIEPFDDLVVINGVTYLQAHNAWLDVFLQLGVIGLIVVGLFVATTLVRTWTFAIDRGGVIALVPAALLTALLVQGLAESRLLIEIGWALLVMIAVATTVRRDARP